MPSNPLNDFEHVQLDSCEFCPICSTITIWVVNCSGNCTYVCVEWVWSAIMFVVIANPVWSHVIVLDCPGEAISSFQEDPMIFPTNLQCKLPAILQHITLHAFSPPILVIYITWSDFLTLLKNNNLMKPVTARLNKLEISSTCVLFWQYMTRMSIFKQKN